MMNHSGRGPTTAQRPPFTGVARRRSDADVPTNIETILRRQSGSQPATLVSPNVGQETHDQDSRLQLLWKEGMSKHMDVPDGYAQVAVLIIKWAPDLDDMQCQKEVDELDALFKDQFRYETRTVQLSATRPHHQLHRELSDFAGKYDSPNNLLVIYYTGHSKFHKDSGVLEFYPSRRQELEGIKAKWNRAEEVLLQDTQADTLAILDTCYASNIVKSIDDDTRSYQLLAASAYSRPTAGPGDNSFTTALIKALKLCVEQSQERPFSLWKLHDEINLQPKRRKNPCYIHDRLKQHSRHIFLTPLKKDEEQRQKTKEALERRASDADLVLRFSLGTWPLTDEQIDALTKHLSKACKQAKSDANVETHSIDWVHFQNRRPNFSGAASVVIAARKMKQRLARRHSGSKIAGTDVIDSVSEVPESGLSLRRTLNVPPVVTSLDNEDSNVFVEGVRISHSEKTIINATGQVELRAQVPTANVSQEHASRDVNTDQCPVIFHIIVMVVSCWIVLNLPG